MPPRKRGPGRPPIGKTARTIVMRWKVTPAEHRKILAAARAAGVSVSEWVRGRVLGEERDDG